MHGRLGTASACLHRLRPADFAAIRGDRGIVRHVLRLERTHAQPGIAEMAAEPGDKHRLADIRAGALQHDGRRHQNSTPICALMPDRKGCLTSAISVTRSAISISSSAAFRPVSTTCVISGFSVSRKAITSSSGI